MAHRWRIRSRSHSSVGVRIVPLTSRSRSSPFAVVRVGRICKQGVVGSSPIVSTQSDQAGYRIGALRHTSRWRIYGASLSVSSAVRRPVAGVLRFPARSPVSRVLSCGLPVCSIASVVQVGGRQVPGPSN